MHRISRHQRSNGRLPLLTAIAFAIAWASAVPAAEVDLETSIVSAPAIADPGQTADITVAYGNNSTADATDARLRLILPPGLFLDWTAVEIGEVESSFSDTGGNQVSLSVDQFSCDHMLVNVVADGSDAPDIPGDSSHEFSVAIPLPEEIPTVGAFVVHAPTSLARVYEYTYGVCDSCSNLSSCFGGPLSTMGPVTADLELVNDPTPDQDQTADMGCHSLDGFTAGNIAVVRRGGCGFGVKALNAENADASGVVIVDNAAGRNIHSIGMNGGDEGALVTIPVVLVSYEDGEALIAGLGASVNATLGGVETEDLLVVSTVFLTSASPDTDPDNSNDSDSTVTIVDYITDEPPDAAFRYSPANPAKGQTVQFTDVSANEPTSWQWDFGDGVGTSTEQNPGYAFADAGVYAVTLTASNEFGSGSTTMDVTVGQLIQITDQYFIPAAAFAEGSGGAFFETDVEINNAGPTAMNYQFVWLPRGEDNSSFQTSSAFRLEPNMSARYENAVSSLFDLDEGLGAIGVVADSPHALLMSRTFNRPGGGAAAGTFGQSIPGVALTDMTTEGVVERILFMSENDDFRGNVGCQNGVNATIRVRLELFSSDGTPLEARNMDLQPWSNSQFSRIFQDHQPVDVGFVDVQSSTPGARFFCYGSVLDAETSDPTTILPQ